jgi:YVTN family beta-propeller protein
MFCASEDDEVVYAINCRTDSVTAQIPVNDPVCIACDPNANRVYCGGQNYPLTAIDAVADTVVATLDLDLSSSALLFNPVLNRLYSLSNYWNELVVINDSGDSLIARLPFNKGTPAELCYNPANGLVYCACGDRPDIVAIDGATNARVADIMCPGHSPFGMTCAIRENKVYVLNGSSSSITVIDGATNQVIKTMPGGASSAALCYSLLDDKLYCASSWDNTVRVYDCADDVLFRVIPGLPCNRLAYNRIDDKVYAWSTNRSPDSLAIIEGSADTIRREIGLERIYASSFDPRDDLLYVSIGDTSASWTIAIDGQLDSIMSRNKCSAKLFCFDSCDDRMFMPSGSWVDVLDCRANHCIDSLTPGSKPGSMCYNPQGNDVFCIVGDSVASIDGKSLRVDTVIPVGINPSALAWNPVQGRLYVAITGSSSVSVIRDKLAPGIAEGGLRPGAGGQKFEAWPSPCRGVLQVRLAASGSKPTLLEIYDVTGRKVMSLGLALGAGASVDLHSLADGVYYVSVNTEPRRQLKIVLNKP